MRTDRNGIMLPDPFPRSGIVPNGIYVGLDGNPVARQPWEYRYSYDEYVKYRHPSFTDEKDYHWDYSDRLWEWSPAKFKDAVAATWPDKPHSQMFHDKKPADIQKFLRAYHGKDIVLVAVLQGCNAGNGNPYWVFGYRDA